MTAPTTIDLTTLLSPDMLERLQAKADRQQTPIPALVREAIESYLDELDDEKIYEDTPDEKILADYDVYKVRLKNPSSGRGKRGGFRVVYL